MARSETLGWSVLRHADTVDVLLDFGGFSNRVSARMAAPNGMDPPEHGPYRALVDRCFSAERVAAFEPELRAIADEIIAAAVEETGRVEVMSAIAEPFAARAQCAYLGWPAETAAALRAWAAESARAIRAGDRAELSRVAGRFDGMIGELLDLERGAEGAGATATLTGWLLEAHVNGAALADGRLISMLRNWTAGELGTIAAAVGIVLEFLARRPDIQRLLRDSPGLRQAAMDEMLRLDAPLLANRRRTTRTVNVGGATIGPDEPISILWPAAQRDPCAFPEPAAFHLDRDPARNLLYGRGPHACPGEGLARLELGVLLDELLQAVPEFSLTPGSAPRRAAYPSGGFSEVRLTLG